MKILKEGKLPPELNPLFRGQCLRCSCQIEVTYGELQCGRDTLTVLCPTPNCFSQIFVKEWLTRTPVSINKFMKYIIAGILTGLLFVIVLFKTEKKVQNSNITQAQNGCFQTTTIEGCQYFMCRSDIYSHIVLAHKGNCTNHTGIQK